MVTSPATFGEASMGLDIARALHGEGDDVAFFFPSSLHYLFRDVPFPCATIDLAGDLVGAVRATMQELGFETLVLIDVLSVFGSTPRGTLPALLRGLPARVVGLDCWNLPETDLTWDTGAIQTHVDPVVLDIPCVRPSPLVRPEAAGAYRSLPSIDPLSPDERAGVRRDAGVKEHERWVLTATATWQDPSYHRDIATARLASHSPELYELLLRRLGEDVCLHHVGPSPFPWAAGNGRYRWLSQMPRAEFRRLLAACDLFLSLNVSATSVAAAVACGVPAVVLTNSLAGNDVEQVEERAHRVLPDDLRRWLAKVLPLFPFRICPLGGHSFTEAILARNPYRATFREVELTDIDGAAAAVVELLEDDSARAALGVKQARFRELTAGLPSVVSRFRELTDGR